MAIRTGSEQFYSIFKGGRARTDTLRPTTFAEKEASGIMFIRPSAAAMTWTRGPVCAIITRHSCSARCRARRRVELAVRSALCLPSSIDAKITARAAAAPALTPSPKSRLVHFSTHWPPYACLRAGKHRGASQSHPLQNKQVTAEKPLWTSRQRIAALLNDRSQLIYQAAQQVDIRPHG